MILATGRAITRGRSEAMWIVFGNALGGLVLLVLVTVGLGAVVTASAAVFTGVKILGAIYLCWLGLHALLTARGASPSDLDDLTDVEPMTTRSPLLRQGFLVGVSNPKSIVSIMAVLPQFIDPSLDNPAAQMLLIGLAGGVAQLVIETVWVLTAGGLRTWFRRRPSRIKSLKAAGGIAMIALAAKLALQRPTA